MAIAHASRLLRRFWIEPFATDAHLCSGEWLSEQLRLAKFSICRALPHTESKRVLVPRKPLGAAVDPHRLVALAWTVGGPARGAPGRSPDLAARLVRLRQRRAFLGSRLSVHRQ